MFAIVILRGCTVDRVTIKGIHETSADKVCNIFYFFHFITYFVISEDDFDILIHRMSSCSAQSTRYLIKYVVFSTSISPLLTEKNFFYFFEQMTDIANATSFYYSRHGNTSESLYKLIVCNSCFGFHICSLSMKLCYCTLELVVVLWQAVYGQVYKMQKIFTERGWQYPTSLLAGLWNISILSYAMSTTIKLKLLWSGVSLKIHHFNILQKTLLLDSSV